MPTHPDCTTAARRGAELSAALGHHVEDAYPAEMDRMAEHGPLVTTMWAVGAKASLLSLAPLLGSRADRGRRRARAPGRWPSGGTALTAVELASAQGRMATVRRDLAAWWEDFDLLITPDDGRPAARRWASWWPPTTSPCGA